MAGIFRGQGRPINGPLLLSCMVLVSALPASAQLYEQPVLVVDPGMHTAIVHGVSSDAAGRIAVTGSDEKTVRVWSLIDGKLLRTIRVPAGPENIGKIYSVAMSPDGELIAAGGYTKWTTSTREDLIYLFETHTGKMTSRISIPSTNHSLAFSQDGRYLAAGLGGQNGLRVYDRDQQWTESFRDQAYRYTIFGLTFAADGRKTAASMPRSRPSSCTTVRQTRMGFSMRWLPWSTICQPRVETLRLSCSRVTER
jgi:WD40 repeat protein